MNAYSLTLLHVFRQDSGSSGGRAMDAAWQQPVNGSRAAAAVAEAAASQQATNSRAAGWKDIGGGGGSRAVAVEAA